MTLKELLDANLDYYELKDLELILEILVEKEFGYVSIKTLLKRVKEVEETY